MHIGDLRLSSGRSQWMQLRSRDKTLDQAFDRPFPVGVEYYRPPVPPPEYWDEDFRRISAAGMSIVRVWYSWDWVETLPTLDALNERLLRRYRSWEDVDAPRSKAAPVEMRLYLQFHRENMADHLGWMADLIDRLDGTHEQRSHGGSYPAPHHETVSPQIDSWGLSHHSSNRLTTDEPYSIACEAYGFQWCRAMGRNNRYRPPARPATSVRRPPPRSRRLLWHLCRQGPLELQAARGPQRPHRLPDRRF